MGTKTWFITGASAGIGRAVVEELLLRGQRVAATARRPGQLDDLAAKHPDLLWTAALDATDTAEVRAVLSRAFAELGTIEVILANAGRGAFGAAEELSDEAIADQIAINLVAPIQLTRAALPFLRGQGGGRIIVTTTMGAQISTPGGSMYHASKWGVEGFLESVIGEIAPFGIGVTMVEPGNIRTYFGANMSIADPVEAYADTPVGQVRGYIASSDNLTGNAPGDPVRVAKAIVASADVDPAPRRLVLGSDAYAAVHQALTGRLVELEAQKSTAGGSDYPT